MKLEEELHPDDEKRREYLVKLLTISAFTMTPLGVVQAAEDGGLHFALDEGVMVVEVEFQPSGVQVTTVVGTVAGSFGAGVWAVPPVGSEVMVMIPDGDLDFQPTVVALTSSGSLPDGIAINTIVVAAPPGGEVLIHDGSGGTEPLVTKSEHESHTHTGLLGGTGSALASTTTPDSSISGTTVLKAK